MTGGRLDIEDLHAYYGNSHVLQGVSMHVASAEIVSLLGRNGAGRSTLARAVMGLVDCHGSIRFDGTELVGRPPYRIAHLGVGYVPESRDVFPTLTVAQNLALGQKGRRPGQWRPEDMYRLFPSLRKREHTPAGVLSGGEQQMLTLCRTLMGDPRLVVVDEPTEGLAPMIVEQVAGFLLELKARGVSVLLIEQKLDIALSICERVYVMGHGQVVFDGRPDELRSRPDIRQEWLEV